MTLAFSTKLKDGTPNYFPQKIIKGWRTDIWNKAASFSACNGKHGCDYINSSDYEDLNPKKHTIRDDKKNRWKVGNLIHPVINNRTPERFQFAPITKCTGVQKIEISHFSDHVEFIIDDKFFGNVFHHGLDMVYEYHNCIRELAVNDGFDSIEQFLKWFDKDFTGKIIHWTDLKY
ncbi:hypothetical protein [Allomuricauda sp. ARW1Y1]|jgi:hypothetical protein|uniref:hypothetical protein n=1 Tax=Allomuricauda sp. ARW1Y1 TaxID=2663843 RepID=UPI0015C6ADBE|nr:hypothetical protein [Muricauda sp. ARW1Y1]NYJ27537.1 hypothetical protein [Muricauda sp. ARW1Y1]